MEQRCIRWLLTVNDLLGQDHIPLTHELMATVLGVHRPTVTLVLRSLYKAGLVDDTPRTHRDAGSQATRGGLL